MKEGWCIHYSGTANSRCEAGHCYKDVARPLTAKDRKEYQASPWVPKGAVNVQPPAKWGLIDRVPCFEENGVDTCPDREFPTPVELAAYEAKIQQFLQWVTTARQAIVEHIEARGMKGRNDSGNVDCPICGEEGTLHYTYAGSYNGHIHAQCATEDCVQWIE